MKLPRITITPPPEQQRERLARWLKEWEAEKILRAESEKMNFTASAPSATGGVNTAIRTGLNMTSKPGRLRQVRLLRRTAGVEPGYRPVYVAVLEKVRKDSFLVAPFGRFAEPAVPGEWLTGLKALPLRVLCLWNSRVVETDVLGQSWLAGRISPEKVQRALEVCRFIRSGTPRVSVQDKELGPPLRHPLDPRLEYQAEEAAVLDETLMAAEKVVRVQVPAPDRGPVTYEIAPSEMRLAAEPRAKYGRSRRRGKRK